MPKELKLDVEVKGLSGWRFLVVKAIALFSKDKALEVGMSLVRYRIGNGSWKKLKDL
jgi:hypothetical protein